LFVVLIVEVGFTQLRVGFDQDEQVLAVDIDQDLANGQLLNPDLHLTIQILTDEELVQLVVLLDFKLGKAHLLRSPQMRRSMAS
jgi:hypothetical protein